MGAGCFGPSQAASSKAAHTGPVSSDREASVPHIKTAGVTDLVPFLQASPVCNRTQVPPLCQGPRLGLANTDFSHGTSSDVAAV